MMGIGSRGHGEGEIGGLPILRRSGRADVSEIGVSVNALKPLLRTVCAAG